MEANEIRSGICERQMEYENFKKLKNGSFAYMDKFYGRMLSYKRIFEKSLDTIGFIVFEKQDKEEVKNRFMSVCDEIYNLIWCVHEYREYINRVVIDGLEFENRFLKICSDDSVTEAYEYMKNQCIISIKEMCVKIKEYLDNVNKQYVKTDIAVLGFSNQFEKLKSCKEYLAPFYKRIMDRTYAHLMTYFYDNYTKEYSKYHCQDVSNFIKKMTEFAGKLEGE